MPKSTTRTPSGWARRSRRWATSTPKASPPRKTLPTPATRMRGPLMVPPPTPIGGRPRGGAWDHALPRGRPLNERFHLLRPEEEAVPRLAQRPQVAAGVVVHRHGQVDAPLVV